MLILADPKLGTGNCLVRILPKLAVLCREFFLFSQHAGQLIR